MTVKIASDCLALVVGQGLQAFFAHETFHPGQFFLPFHYGPEPWIRYAVRDAMATKRLPGTGPTSLGNYPAMGGSQLAFLRHASAFTGNILRADQEAL